MKKFLPAFMLILLSVVLVFSSCGLLNRDDEKKESGPSEGLEYILSDDGTYYIVSGIGTCKDKDVVIPETNEGLPVKEIGDSAFVRCDSLTSVTIPDGVTTIGDGAFYWCTSLTICCEATSKPSGWDSDWNYSGCPVVWGHIHEYENGKCVCGKSEN